MNKTNIKEKLKHSVGVLFYISILVVSSALVVLANSKRRWQIYDCRWLGHNQYD